MAKPAKTNRQAVIDEMRRKQKGDERRRGLMIVGVCTVVALLIIGAAAYQPIKNWWDQRAFDEMNLAEIGEPASACSDVTTKTAEGSQDHVPEGTPIPYADAPPAFGTHYDIWDGIERKFYSADDRPDVGELVHNLEHGYTILWYDETIAADEEQVDQMRAIASKFEDDDNLRSKFKAVPWTESDGKPFPDDQHVALTHWSVSGGKNGDEQVGVWQYCSDVSGEALEDFMNDYPYTDSPEPNAV